MKCLTNADNWPDNGLHLGDVSDSRGTLTFDLNAAHPLMSEFMLHYATLGCKLQYERK